jgi:histidyl-tRNA synthetase
VADLGRYLKDNLAAVPAAMRERVDINPLRLYDAKDDGVQELLAAFKPITEALCEDCRVHHREVTGALAGLAVPYEQDHALVRGLDYYGRTTFEIVGRTKRKQSSLAGGGRYDGLIEQCGGPPTPAVGFSIGIERTLLHLDDRTIDPQRSRQAPVDVYVACRGAGAQRLGLECAGRLRGACRVEVDTTDRSFKAQAKSANLRTAKFLLLVGDDEVATGTVQLKNLDDGEQTPVAVGGLLAAVRESLEG